MLLFLLWNNLQEMVLTQKSHTRLKYDLKMEGFSMTRNGKYGYQMHD